MNTETETKPADIDDNVTDCDDNPRTVSTNVSRVLGYIYKAIDIPFTILGYFFILLFSIIPVLLFLSIPVFCLIVLWYIVSSIFSGWTAVLVFAGVIFVLGGLYKASVIVKNL